MSNIPKFDVIKQELRSNLINSKSPYLDLSKNNQKSNKFNNQQIEDITNQLISELNYNLFPSQKSDIEKYSFGATKDLLHSISRDFPINYLELKQLINLNDLISNKIDVEKINNIRFYSLKQGLAYAYNFKRNYDGDVINLTLDYHFKSKGQTFKLLKDSKTLNDYFEKSISAYKNGGMNSVDKVLSECYHSFNGHFNKSRELSIDKYSHNEEIRGRLRFLFLSYIDNARIINDFKINPSSIDNQDDNKLNNYRLCDNPLIYPLVVDVFNLGRKIGGLIANPDDTTGIISNKYISDLPKHKAVPEYAGLVQEIGKALVPNQFNQIYK